MGVMTHGIEAGRRRNLCTKEHSGILNWVCLMLTLSKDLANMAVISEKAGHVIEPLLSTKPSGGD